MAGPAAQFDSTTLARCLRGGLAAFGLYAAGGALPLQADEAAANTVVRDAGVPWMSGGVGEEARAEMQRNANAYNVHVLFSDRTGHYLAAIPFSLQRTDGSELQSGVSDGPLLYLRLPAGRYRLVVEIAGVRQSQALTVTAGKRPVQLNFLAAERQGISDSP